MKSARLQSLLDRIGAPDFEVTTPRDRALFYSGKDQYSRHLLGVDLPPNAHIAELAASSARGYRAITHTPGGKWLAEQNLFDSNSGLSPAEATEVWAQASRKFAERASGNVTVYVTGACHKNIFFRVELPILLSNPAVTSINHLPREQLKDLKESVDGHARGLRRVMKALNREWQVRLMRETETPAVLLESRAKGLPVRA